MWITNAAVPLGVPSIERDGHPFFGFWKNRTPTPNSTLIYRFCFAAFEEFFKRYFTSNLRFTDSELVLIDHRNWTCYLWFSEKPAFGCYDTSWVSDSLGSISTKLRMCSKIYAWIMNYTVWPRWSPNVNPIMIIKPSRPLLPYTFMHASVHETTHIHMPKVFLRRNIPYIIMQISTTKLSMSHNHHHFHHHHHHY